MIKVLNISSLLQNGNTDAWVSGKKMTSFIPTLNAEISSVMNASLASSPRKETFTSKRLATIAKGASSL